MADVDARATLACDLIRLLDHHARRQEELLSGLRAIRVRLEHVAGRPPRRRATAAAPGRSGWSSPPLSLRAGRRVASGPLTEPSPIADVAGRDQGALGAAGRPTSRDYNYFADLDDALARRRSWPRGEPRRDAGHQPGSLDVR